MKQTLCVFIAGICAVLAAAPAVGQVADFPIEPEALRRLGVTEEELEAMIEADRESRATIREAQIELEILTAQLKRALLPLEPQMREVENLLRGAMDWEYKMRLAQITRQVRIRQVLGDDRYTRIREAIRRRQQQQRQQQQRQAERPLQRPNAGQ